MEEITLKIPTDKLSFFIDLVKQLGFEISSEKDWFDDLTENQKEHLQKSIEQHNNGENISNEEAQKRIKEFIESKKS